MKIVTLANLAESTEQEVFDHVVRHARKQKQHAMISGVTCVYRTESGDACFGGCLMTDEEHSKIMEQDRYLNSSSWMGLVEGNRATRRHEIFIMNMQHIHDQYEVFEWEDQFKSFSSRHNLVYTAPLGDSNHV